MLVRGSRPSAATRRGTGWLFAQDLHGIDLEGVKMEVTAMAMTFVLSVGLGLVGARAMLSALFYFMTR
jgi:hypothetical protein